MLPPPSPTARGATTTPLRMTQSWKRLCGSSHQWTVSLIMSIIYFPSFTTVHTHILIMFVWNQFILLFSLCLSVPYTNLPIFTGVRIRIRMILPPWIRIRNFYVDPDPDPDTAFSWFLRFKKFFFTFFIFFYVKESF